jgi:hypothetical protein
MISDSSVVLCCGAAMVIAVALHIYKSSAALFNRCATANTGSAAVVSGSASAAVDTSRTALFNNSAKANTVVSAALVNRSAKAVYGNTVVISVLFDLTA